MSNIIYIFLILFIAYNHAQAAIPKANVIQNSKFADYDKGYSIQLPDQWQVQKDFMGLDVFAAAPANNPENRSEANISVIAFPIEAGMGLEEFFKMNLASLTNALTDFKIIETGNVAFHGFDGMRTIYTHKSQDNLKLRVVQDFTVHDHMGYIITGSCIANEFDKYTPIFEKSAKTLKFY